ncbi:MULTISPECIES: hypothetical protein [Pseudomonas]|jgi:hypothetical protein|uniref:Uncharacterized protein n=1 Tax=Pseudomonas frederiksbergensis TaxID=104087 RepID=A0A0B1Z7K2_9PSED|nr:MULTISPECIES: hypothetical protein [Pseudomonas]KHK65151.1 hypothetical protein JZ00_08885 [Pseudomonas frederiksbergensis]MBI6617287.1 hypothetical protein [Pseudomonas corrugata]MBI6691839.1 hypothetical protein [Pseudomonas corrugata]WRV68096.1 hypothetical protein VQ575_25080 [Pseudomonas frederiksbergensis]
MPFYEDVTDFKNGQRNGWENGPDLPDGTIELEKGNYFWRGNLEVSSQAWPMIQPSLMKTFDLSVEERNKYYDIIFHYRIQERQAGEAGEITIAMCPGNVHFEEIVAWIDNETEINQWIKVVVKPARWFGPSPVLWIGTLGSRPDDRHRKIDIDNITIRNVHHRSIEFLRLISLR